MICTTNSHLEVAVITHPGMAGKKNEDRFAVSSYQMSETDPTPSVFATWVVFKFTLSPAVSVTPPA